MFSQEVQILIYQICHVTVTVANFNQNVVGIIKFGFVESGPRI